MYSDSDLDSAVDAGAISAEAAAAFRAHVAKNQGTILADEESFRLLTGFNDIFVVIAVLLLLVAVTWIGVNIHPSIAGAAVAGTSWGLAEFFTRKRRMALPSILLLLSFVGGMFCMVAGLVVFGGGGFLESRSQALLTVGGTVTAAIAARWHWQRFHVPITVAAGALAVVGLMLSFAVFVKPETLPYIRWLVLLGGLGLFAFAMQWDISDRARHTRRSDVAFWLHLAAAPMIAHPIFFQLGVFGGDVGAGKAVIVIVLYIAMALVSLAIDRRAMLVSALAYVLYAISALFKSFGAIGINVALTALVIGSALLLLSAFWHVARRGVVCRLPAAWQERLPALDRPATVPSR